MALELACFWLGNEVTGTRDFFTGNDKKMPKCELTVFHDPTTIIPPVYPPKCLHKHCFQFLLGLEIVPREVKTILTQTFFGGRVKKMYFKGIVKIGIKWE